jgi:predicted DCC family thiol-disulfide oxidoreductase YuxK
VTLLYDGACRLCRFAARLVARLDTRRAVALVPFEDPAAAPFLATIPEEERLTSWHLMLSDGRRYSEGAGALVLLERLPSTKYLAKILRPLPVDSLYRIIARNRGRIGSFVPDGPAPRT